MNFCREGDKTLTISFVAVLCAALDGRLLLAVNLVFLASSGSLLGTKELCCVDGFASGMLLNPCQCPRRCGADRPTLVDTTPLG